MFQFRFDMHEQGVPATDNQRNVRLKVLKVRRQRFAPNPRRVQMRLVVVNADEWLTERKRHRLCRLHPDHQRSGQARSLCGGNGIQIFGPHSGFAQSRLRHRRQILQVLARG